MENDSGKLWNKSEDIKYSIYNIRRCYRKFAVFLVVSLTSVAGGMLFSTSDTIMSDYPSNFKSHLAEQLCFQSQTGPTAKIFQEYYISNLIVPWP